MGLTHRYKTAVFFAFYICCFSISILSWDTTTSAFRKQTDVIWKFYFRFRLWTFYRRIHVILHRRNKHYPNWTITDRVMTLCRFFKMAAIPSQIYFRFLVLWRELFAYHISTRYLNPRPRCYFFGLLKTNTRHIEILLQVSTLNSLPSSVRDSAPTC